VWVLAVPSRGSPGDGAFRSGQGKPAPCLCGLGARASELIQTVRFQDTCSFPKENGLEASAPDGGGQAAAAAGGGIARYLDAGVLWRWALLPAVAPVPSSFCPALGAGCGSGCCHGHPEGLEAAAACCQRGQFPVLRVSALRGWPAALPCEGALRRGRRLSGCFCVAEEEEEEAGRAASPAAAELLHPWTSCAYSAGRRLLWSRWRDLWSSQATLLRVRVVTFLFLLLRASGYRTCGAKERAP